MPILLKAASDMKRHTFVHRTRIAAPAEEVFDWHARPGAFERLTPPWASVTQLEHTGGIKNGARRVLVVKLGPLRRRWTLEHCDYVEGRQFADVQIEGPFRYWKHVHRMIPEGPDACLLEDDVEYALPAGPLSKFLSQWFLDDQLRRLFEYRHRVVAEDFASGGRSHHANPGGNPHLHLRRVVVTGASGLMGSALVPALQADGYRVDRLVRHPQHVCPQASYWNPTKGTIDASFLHDAEVVIHLAGEDVLGDLRWSRAKKREVFESRVRGTRLLARALAQLPEKPQVFISASAVGFYGDRGDELLDEQSSPGRGFLADVCQAWEAATKAAQQAGIRVILARLGMILSSQQGALGRLLVPFQLGAGGRIGSGEQFWSWITLDDAIGATRHCLTNTSLAGPVNFVAPHLVTNQEFAQTLAQVLRRPAWVKVPAAGARLAWGEMADELLLKSTRVKPRKLLSSGYQFQHPKLPNALRQVLAKRHAA